MDARTLIVTRAARFFHDGDLVNLGIGMPTLVANHLPEGVNITLQSENGFIGLGPTPEEGHVDKDMVNAGGQPVTILPGGVCFDSATSFGLIRGGHVDATVLGALEVDQEGNLANWMIPGKTAAGMGGAMDLVTGSKITVVMTTQTDKAGNPKIVQKTEMPLTGYHCIDYIVTEMGCFHVTPEGLKLFEVAPGVTPEEVQAKTGAKLIFAEPMGCMVKE